jgi:hypothetical protein
MSEKELGVVSALEVGFEDHGIFGFNLALDFGTAHQGTGWYGLVTVAPLIKLYRFLGIDRAEDAKGIYLLVERDSPYGLIVALERPVVDGGARLVLKELFDE